VTFSDKHDEFNLNKDSLAGVKQIRVFTRDEDDLLGDVGETVVEIVMEDA
jgi:hypothetical protein